MDQESDLTEQRPEEIRQHIDDTRSDLTERLEAFEQRVKDTVSEARSAVVDTVESVKHSVDDTVQAVKGTVHDTVASVKHALDLNAQVKQHPLGMLAASVAAGYLLGRVFFERSSVSSSMRRGSAEVYPPMPANGRQQSEPIPLTVKPALAEQGVLHDLGEKFAPEIQKLKGLAIGTLMGLARDLMKGIVTPVIAPELERVIDNVTTKLGGKPLAGPLVDFSE